MKVKHVSLIVLFLSTFFSLQATTNCEAPAPTSASIDDQWPTAMAISWSEVPGALSYKVVVSEFITGNVVETAYLPARTTFTATGLTPDVAYHYDISASLCASGPYGDPISLSAGGIIVDIILQITCEDGGDTTFDDAVSAGFSSEELEFYVNRTQTECYLVEVDPAFSPFNETYTFGITSGSTFQVRYESGGGDGEFLMSTDENAIHAGVAYHGNQTPLAINLFDYHDKLHLRV
ncbi:MAG: fibronectin type III domain-containing protein, partial [Bacteroidota bacterium]